MTIREVTPLATVPPAPLGRSGLDQAMLPFGQSRMLPKAAYLDDAVLAWERAHLFSRWRCLGRTDDVLAPCRMRAFSVGRSGVLVVRDGSGELRAFENACRHRGHELLPCGSAADTGKALVCPYHAWAYRPDGSLLAAPRFAESDNFRAADHGLFEVPLRDWHGWLWIDPSGHGGDFAEHVGALEPVIAAYGASSLRTVVSHEYDVHANWKVVVENYNECYHCPMIHPELCRVSPPHSGENIDGDGAWVGGWMDLSDHAATMSLDGHTDGTVMAHLDEHEQRTVMYVAVLPNALISLHPDYVMTHLLTPIDAETIRIECSWAFPESVVERVGFDPSYAVDFWDITNRQDWAACESVQRGMASPHFRPGPLANVEDAVYHFVAQMARRYLGSSEG